MAIHIVQSGDSLWKLSQKYGVQVETIMDANGLTSSLLMLGLALYIPTQTLITRIHAVEPGDTLSNLARRFQTTVPLILYANPELKHHQLQNGLIIQIPTSQKIHMTTLGYFVPYTLSSFFNSFQTYADQLTYLAVVSYSFTKDGRLYLDLQDEGIADTCHQHGVTPLLTVRNIIEDGGFSTENVDTVLQSKSNRDRLIHDIFTTIEHKNYSGVSIDFEFISPAQRNNFILFLSELKQAIGTYLLHVSVHSKTEDSLTNPITGAHDYEAIGKVADIVAVMTMDYGYPGGPPNPVTPLPWLEEVIRYSIANIDPIKLQVALPLYGYDWNIKTNEAQGLSLLAAQNRAITEKVSVHFSDEAVTPYYRYWKEGTAHSAWFDDIRSYYEKYRLIDYYELLGVTFWETRLPFPQNWLFLKEYMKIGKSSVKNLSLR